MYCDRNQKDCIEIISLNTRNLNVLNRKCKLNIFDITNVYKQDRTVNVLFLQVINF